MFQFVPMDLQAPVRRLDRFQQRHDVLAVAAATVKKFGEDSAGTFATSIAFYAFFSLFPLLLVLMTILGFVLAGDPSALETVKDSVLGNFPVIGDTLQNETLSGSGLALVVGILLSLWAGLGVTGAAKATFDRVWDIPRAEREGFLQTKLRGIILLIVLGTLFVLASGASGLVAYGVGGWMLFALTVLISILLNLCLFMASFKLLCTADIPWHALLPGAAIAAVLWEGLQLAGGAYIGHISSNHSAYGTFALVLGFLAWLHIGTQMMVYCAEFNSVLARRQWPKQLIAPAEPPVSDA
jgi:YihY family inner membrane protein